MTHCVTSLTYSWHCSLTKSLNLKGPRFTVSVISHVMLKLNMSLQISLLTKVLPADKTDHIAVNQPPVSVHITLAVKLLVTIGTTVVFNLVVN